MEYLSFIFKAKHFQYENEVRIIKVMSLEDEKNKNEIKIDKKDIGELYIELDREIKCEEVILGSKTENKQAIASFIHKKGIKEVTKSIVKYK